MIKPNKYMNLDMSVVNVGGLILKTLLARPVQKYEEVEDFILNTLGEAAKPIIIYALDFLYIIGKILYSSVTDTIKLVK